MATQMGEALAEVTPSIKMIAEHAPVKLVERRDGHTRVWEILREVETTYPDGTWLRTFESSLRTDGYSVKCRNETKYVDDVEQLHNGENKQAWQRVSLSEGTHRIGFLAYTNGQAVGGADVFPYASYTGQPGNAVFSMSWENFVITEVDIPNESDCYGAYVWGRFNVLSGQTQLQWDIGVEVKVNDDPNAPRLVYVASLSCWKE